MELENYFILFQQFIIIKIIKLLVQCNLGHIFTIKPMINEGSWKDVNLLDNWITVTEGH